MEGAIILLAFTTIINAFHISYIYKELRRIIDNEHEDLIKLVYKIDKEIKYTNGIEMQKLINDIKSGKLKKEIKKVKSECVKKC